MSAVFSLPTLNSEASFYKYLQEIRKFPCLESGEEYMLSKRYLEHQDLDAAHKLVTSHLKLVAKIALSFKNYGLPLIELVSEGNIGLMQAVKKFNPDLGYRLSTYASWWIKAAIQEFVIKSWSLVKIGTTAAQKKLFFNLNKIKKKICQINQKSLDVDQVQIIADQLSVSTNEVEEMNSRLSGTDLSLNTPLMEGEGDELLDMIPESKANQEVTLFSAQESRLRHNLLQDAMKNLSPREQHILNERRLKDEPSTLDDLGKFYNISRERVRQIENRVIEKLKQFMIPSFSGHYEE